MLRKCQRILFVVALIFCLAFSIFFSICRLKQIFLSVKTNLYLKNKCKRSTLQKNSHIENNHTDISLVQNSILLGERKERKGFLTIGYLHTEKCKNSEDLSKSLGSLITHSKYVKNHQVSIVVLLQDCSNEDLSNFLKIINSKFKRLVQLKMLQIVKTPDEFYRIDTKIKGQYWKHFTSYSTEYIQNCKALVRDMAFLWQFSTNQSDYFLQFTDHVIVKEDIISFLLKYVKDWDTKSLLWADMGLFTGRVYKTKDLPEIIEIFKSLGSHLPAVHILKSYKFFRNSRNIGKIPSSVISYNYNFTGDNPSAVVTTSLLSVDGNLQVIYNNRRGRFWAYFPKEGDFILIDFKSHVRIDRILIETGEHLQEDIIPGASLSVVFADSPTNNKAECHRSSYTMITEFPGAILELNGDKLFPKPISCIKIIINQLAPKEFRSWLIIRTFAFFKKL